MNFSVAVLLSFIVVLVVACSKNDNDTYGNCQLSISTFEAPDTNVIEKQVKIAAAAIGTVPSGAEYSDVERMLKEMAQSLENEACGISAEAACVMCIDTGTPISEIVITFPSADSTKLLAIDLFTREGKMIEFLGVH